MSDLRVIGSALEVKGPITVNQVDVPTVSSASTLTNKTLTAPIIAGGLLGMKVTNYTADGAIAVESHVAVISKAGSAAAMTLAAPTVNGTFIIIVAASDFAHVTTGTNLFHAGETGSPFNKVTTAAFHGSAALLIGYNSLWYVVADQIAVIGD